MVSVASAPDQVSSFSPSPVSRVEHERGLARLVVDRPLPGGARLVAVAEVVQRTPEGDLAAAAALAAFEEAFAIAVGDGIESGLVRAYGAANVALRAANRGREIGQRLYAGLTAVVLRGDLATMACIPPGQALLVQDGQVLGVPDLASWSPDYMPDSDVERPEPLGQATFVHPIVRKTRVANGDQIVLGTSAIGSALGRRTGDERPTADLIEHVERALAASGIEGAYATRVRFEEARAPRPSVGSMTAFPVELRRPAQAALGKQPIDVHPMERLNGRPPWREERFERVHRRMIDASERILGGREPEPLPYAAKRRGAAPLGAGSLERHLPRHQLSFGPSLRCRLPRGPRIPVTKRSAAILVLVAAMLVAAAFGWDVRQARADRQDRFLNTARIELQLAESAATLDEAIPHLTAVRNALDVAFSHGADDNMITTWRTEAQQVEDRHTGVIRLSAPTRLGALPAGFGESAKLVMAGASLYLVAGDVFVVDPGRRALIQVLRAGDRIDGIKAKPITGATREGDDLLVTDGASLFRRDERGRWSAERLAPKGGGWAAIECGSFRGSFYLLSTEPGQILKFGAGRLRDEPSQWVADADLAELKEHVVVDMVVDGSIHVLTADGMLNTLHKGSVKETRPLAGKENEGEIYIALTSGSQGGALYVLARKDGEIRIVRHDRAAGEFEQLLLPAPGTTGYNGAADRALAGAADFAVDESAGIVYFVTADGIWSAALR